MVTAVSLVNAPAGKVTLALESLELTVPPLAPMVVGGGVIGSGQATKMLMRSGMASSNFFMMSFQSLV